MMSMVHSNQTLVVNKMILNVTRRMHGLLNIMI